MAHLDKLIECRSCDLSKKTGFRLGLKNVFSNKCTDEKNQIFRLTAGKETSDATEVMGECQRAGTR